MASTVLNPSALAGIIRHGEHRDRGGARQAGVFVLRAGQGQSLPSRFVKTQGPLHCGMSVFVLPFSVQDAESQLLCGHSLAISDTIAGVLQAPSSSGHHGSRTYPYSASSAGAGVANNGQLEDRKLRKGLRLLALLYSEQAMRYLEQSNHDAARPLLQRSLSMLESLNVSDSGEVAAALTRLAWLGRRQGKHGEAEEACRRALKLSEEAMETRETSLAMNNLAVTYRMQGKFQEVDRLYDRAAALQETLTSQGSGGLGSGGSREEAAILSNRAWALCDSKEWECNYYVN